MRANAMPRLARPRTRWRCRLCCRRTAAAQACLDGRAGIDEQLLIAGWAVEALRGFAGANATASHPRCCHTRAHALHASKSKGKTKEDAAGREHLGAVHAERGDAREGGNETDLGLRELGLVHCF